MNPEKIALFDLDGTLADFDSAMRRDMERLASPDEPKFDIYDENAPEWFENRQRLIKLTPGWWKTLPVIPVGAAILEIAKSIGFEIHILTKGPKYCINAWTEKVDWVQTIFGRDMDITVTHDKGLVYGRVLVDDYPPFMDRWLTWRPRGVGIMPENKGNKKYSNPKVVKANADNLDAVREALQMAFDRD